MAPATKKLSPETLRRNGIVIEMEVSEDGWPDEIAQIRDRILSFDCIIPPKEIARQCLDPHLLTSVYKKLPQADRDGWFNGEVACNKQSILPQSEAIKRHLKNLKAAYTLYELAVEWEYKGGMKESKLGEKLADYVFKEWKKHADQTSGHSRFDGEFATTFGRDTESFGQAWHVRNDWHSHCSVAETLHERELLSVPKPDWYFGFLIHNDIRSPRKTDKGRTRTVFSLTNLSLLEESEALHSCPLMSLNKYCADIKRTPQRAKAQRGKPGSEEAGLEDRDWNESDEYGYATSEDEDYEPESEEEEDSSVGSLEDDEELSSETYEEITPSRGYKHKEDVAVARDEDTDRTNGASDIETETSHRNEDEKLTCYPWAVVEVKRPGAAQQEIRKCYYQAANSSSACVALLRGLSESPAHDYHHPVVAMTFIGGNARVFLTYAEPLVGADSDDDDDEPVILYRMRCIWKGRLDILWNALQLRRMLDTIQYWALQKYRTDIDSDIRRRLRNHRLTSNPSSPSSFRQAEEQRHSRTTPSPLAKKPVNRPGRHAQDNINDPLLVRLLEQLGVNSSVLGSESSPRTSKGR